jgi:hypothetical protein
MSNVTHSMETLVAAQVRDAQEHPVLPGAMKYDIRAQRFHWDDQGAAVLELELSTHDDYATLRFHKVEDLHVESGEIPGGVLVKIQDTSGCPSGSHHIPGVRVGGVGESKLSFWAGDVVRLPSGLCPPCPAA